MSNVWPVAGGREQALQLLQSCSRSSCATRRRRMPSVLAGRLASFPTEASAGPQQRRPWGQHNDRAGSSGAAVVSGWPPIGELRAALPPGSGPANALRASLATALHAILAGQLPSGPRRSCGPHRRTRAICGRRSSSTGPPAAGAGRGTHGLKSGNRSNWTAQGTIVGMAESAQELPVLTDCIPRGYRRVPRGATFDVRFSRARASEVWVKPTHVWHAHKVSA